MGLCGLVILFAYVPCPPARGQGPFFPLVCLLSSVPVSVLPSVVVSSYNRQKKNGLCWVVSLWVVLWCWVSPIGRKYRRLQAGFLSSLLRLFCRALLVCLSRWGLLCNINYFYLWPPCGSYNSMLLLCFSCCFLLSF